MSDLIRLSISLEKPLADRLARLVQSEHFVNRSEYVRDMIRERLVEREWTDDKSEVMGTLTLIYDHEKRELARKLTHIQHDHHHTVLATTHVHLDHRLCAEAIMMKGQARAIRHLANLLRQQKGVLHASLSVSSTGKDLR